MTEKTDRRDTGVFTIPNLLSFMRFASAPFVFLFFSLPAPEGRWLTLGFLALSFSTDFFDGFLARKLNQQSDLGRILDPLADKAVVLALLAALVLYRGVPLPVVLAVLARDLLILGGGLLVKVKRGVVLESNIWGKAATFILMVAFLVFIFEELRIVALLILGAGLVLALVSFVTYVVLFIKTMRGT
ncbi:MAG: CDP-alcohol phosphatidyltransferase family protein [Spirochaetales bacterium]|nr:CDP-alcohol phosphatidyltransferase family protein [Spirochaetales bacterium]